VQKRLSFRRRTVVVAVVSLAFAAAAGVGLAQITAGPSPTAAAVSTTTQSTTDPTTSSTSGEENDLAKDDEHDAKKSGEQTTSADDHDGGQGQEKVDVCHVTGSGKSHTINIAEPAVAAHVAHGDTKGECAETTTTAAVKPQHSRKTHVKKTKPAHVTAHVSHGKPTHVSHAKPTHTPHGKPTPNVNSDHQTHGNSAGGGDSSHGNGHK
jgi:hypothetical protein